MNRFELQTLTEYTDEAILQELRRVASLHSEGPLTQDAYHKLSPRVSCSTVTNRFGSWRQALVAAGLSHHLFGQGLLPEYTDEAILQELKQVASLHSEGPFTAVAYSKLSPRVSRYTLFRRFGSWEKALAAAGLSHLTSKLSKRYTDLQCYENIIGLWTHYGRQPHYHELKKPPSTVGPKAYVLRWRSWRRALAAFIEWANAEEQDDPERESPIQEIASLPSPPRTKPRRLSPEDRHEIPLKLKWKVHLRDGFRCLACGRSPANDLTVELHADHIIPWADGGKTILENLQTLCRDHNLGKGKSFGKVE